MAANINIKSFKPQHAKFIIKHPATGETEFEGEDGKMIQGVLTICGYESPEFVAAVEMAEDQRQNRIEPWNMDTGRKEYRKLLGACIVGWENNGFFSEPWSVKGAEEFTANAEYSWMIAQLAEFLEDRRNFFTVPSREHATS